MPSRKNQFYICEHCGNLLGLIEDRGVPLVCCGDPMKGLVPNTVEASAEKHLPAVTLSGNTVEVHIGSAAHPMEESHHINFVYLETERGGQRKNLKVGEAPKLTFVVADDTPLSVYAYCNLHGLWKTAVR
jgi:superoxide reductase